MLGPEPAMDAADQVLELALAAQDVAEFQRGVLEVLDRLVGHGGAFFIAASGSGGPTLALSGLGELHRSRLASGAHRYAAELAPVLHAAHARGGVAVDSDVLGAQLATLRYHRELVAPLGGGHSLLCPLTRQGGALGLIVLGREPSRAFRPPELGRVQRVRRAVTLGLMALAGAEPGTPPGVALTGRERELGDLVSRGYTNPEIALALGTSPHTVRNQLARLFVKLEVTTRAELVRRWFGR